MELKVIDFIKSHNNWEELLKAEPYNLKMSKNEFYAMLSYTPTSNFNEPIVRECRGLVVDLTTRNPRALSFIKFFNVQEDLAATIDWSSAKVQEKVDGSKILVWYNTYDKHWEISTSSIINANLATVNDFGLTFQKLFYKALKNNNLNENFCNILDKNYCYTFELVAPENRVVVPYKNADIYFIGKRNAITFEEVAPSADEILSKLIKVPASYSLSSLEDCLAATSKMSYDEEGFVVVDKNWNRVKIKSPEYVAVHHIRSNINSKRAILKILEDGKKDEVLKLYPEYQKYFDLVETSFLNFKFLLRNSVEQYNFWFKNHSNLIQKDKALFILQLPKKIQNFLFAYAKEDCISFDLFFQKEWSKLTMTKKLELLGLKEQVVKDDDYIEE